MSCCVDVDDVKFVINYDYPQSSEDYVHRIGRTGRSSKTGTSYTFFTPSNAKQAQDLISVLQEAGQEVSPMLYQLGEMARSGAFAKGGKSKLIFNTLLRLTHCLCKCMAFWGYSYPWLLQTIHSLQHSVPSTLGC